MNQVSTDNDRRYKSQSELSKTAAVEFPNHPQGKVSERFSEKQRQLILPRPGGGVKLNRGERESLRSK